jgi:hypothetical protein
MRKKDPEAVIEMAQGQLGDDGDVSVSETCARATYLAANPGTGHRRCYYQLVRNTSSSSPRQHRVLKVSTRGTDGMSGCTTRVALRGKR